MSISESFSEDPLFKIIQTSYENRSAEEHKKVAAIILSALPELTDEQARIMSLFIQTISQGDGESQKNFQISGLILQRNESEDFVKIPIFKQEDISNLNFGKMTLNVSFQALSKCKRIQNLEAQIKFLRSCKYFEGVPKKRLYHVLRNAEIMSYSFGQCVYREGDYLSPGDASVYLVQTGQFSFDKQLGNQQTVRLYQFGEGYLFGSQQHVEDHHEQKREFTVSCRSSKGVVFKFTEQFFNSFLKQSCESQFTVNREKMSVFLQERMRKALINRQPISTSEHKLVCKKKSHSVSGTFLTMPRLMTERSTNLKLSLLSRPAPLSSKLPSLNSKAELSKVIRPSQIVKTFNPEYQEQIRILNKKHKLQRLRELINSKPAPCRSEIFLSLVKSSWKNRKVQSRFVDK